MVAWNPWRALRDRTHITLLRRRLPDGILGVYGRRPPVAAIVLDDRLDRQERRAVLAHELIHDERGGSIERPGMPRTWDDVVRREELIIDREVARRLVPPDELSRFARAREELGESIGAAEVAEEFDVPEWVAMDALKLFVQSRSGV